MKKIIFMLTVFASLSYANKCNPAAASIIDLVGLLQLDTQIEVVSTTKTCGFTLQKGYVLTYKDWKLMQEDLQTAFSQAFEDEKLTEKKRK